MDLEFLSLAIFTSEPHPKYRDAGCLDVLLQANSTAVAQMNPQTLQGFCKGRILPKSSTTLDWKLGQLCTTVSTEVISFFQATRTLPRKYGLSAFSSFPCLRCLEDLEG